MSRLPTGRMELAGRWYGRRSRSTALEVIVSTCADNSARFGSVLVGWLCELFGSPIPSCRFQIPRGRPKLCARVWSTYSKLKLPLRPVPNARIRWMTAHVHVLRSESQINLESFDPLSLSSMTSSVSSDVARRSGLAPESDFLKNKTWRRTRRDGVEIHHLNPNSGKLRQSRVAVSHRSFTFNKAPTVSLLPATLRIRFAMVENRWSVVTKNIMIRPKPSPATPGACMRKEKITQIKSNHCEGVD